MVMKTSIKLAAKAAIAVTGVISFIFLMGEPTQEFTDRVASSFGGLTPYIVFAAKMACLVVLAVCYKCWERIEPGVFDN